MEHGLGLERPPAMPDPVSCHESLMLIRLSGWVQASIDVVFADEGLRHRHYQTVSALRDGTGKGQQALADKLRIDKATMVSVVAELERRGYVARERNPADKRHYLLWATDEGLAWLATADERVGEVEDEIFAPLSAAQRLDFLDLVKALFSPPA